jgi:hypothetical protein
MRRFGAGAAALLGIEMVLAGLAGQDLAVLGDFERFMYDLVVLMT